MSVNTHWLDSRGLEALERTLQEVDAKPACPLTKKLFIVDT